MTFSSIKTKINDDLAYRYKDRREHRNAHLLLKILSVTITMNIVITLALILNQDRIGVFATAISITSGLFAFSLVRRGYLQPAALFFLVQGWAGVAVIPLFIAGSAPIVFPVFLILLFVAITILNKKQIMLYAALIFSTILATYFLTISNLLPEPIHTIGFNESYMSQLGTTVNAFALFWYLRNTLVEITNQAEINEFATIKSNLKLQKEIEIRKQTEAELQHERETLVEKVKEQTAELRFANDLLKDASKRKDAFLATMSHELRTPLNVVITGSQAMQLGIYGALNDKQAEKITGIQSSGQHLLSLINDILDVSKIAAGEEKIALKPVNLVEVCREATGLVENLAKKGNLTLSLELDDSVTQVLGDRRRLKQIVTNLLSNSIKFTPEGGKVGVIVEGNETEKSLTLTVWDTGIGIPQENIAALFEPFIQVDSSLSRKHNGTGIGLSLVKQLSEMHGGSVHATSEIGQGSQFVVTLPWQPNIDEENEISAKVVDSTISF